MKQPEFYPHPVEAIEIRETHISKVFLTGYYVYKLKKPVNFEFLDFSTPARRRHFCRREVILNRRLTQSLYLSVETIHWDGQRYALEGPGPVVEYAVKMIQLPEHRSMAALLSTGGFLPSDMELLARRLSDFYRKAGTGGYINTFGSLGTVWRNCEENFRQMERLSNDCFEIDLLGAIRGVTRAFLYRKRNLFNRRVKEGKIRDCHGDLRADHIYFDGGIQIIDCIEFNERFRYSDIAADIAFLVMDLESRGHGELARKLLTSIVHRTEDADLYTLIDFYCCYRAVVRAKTAAFRATALAAGDPEEKAFHQQCRRYMDLAFGYARRFTRPTLWIVCGLPASGKSTVASALASALELSVFNSDVVRKELFGLTAGTPLVVPYGAAIYSREATALTYGQLLLKAQEEIRHGRPVILDATFSLRHQRREAARLAGDMDANIHIVECVAPEKILRKRLAERISRAGVSDAREEHLQQIRASRESVDRRSESPCFRVRTDQPVEMVLESIFTHFYRYNPL